jgi:RHS repeat-associated protein
VTKHIFAGEARMVSKMESSVNPNPARMFYSPDNVGSTTYVTDAAGTLIEHDRYFPFGETWGSSERVAFGNPNASVNNHRNWLFTGKELDTDTGLYYFGARYYDPRSSTWTSPDPILASYMQGAPNGGVFAPRNLGLYTYTWNNPIILRDPTGMSPENDRVSVTGSGRNQVTRIEFDDASTVSARAINSGPQRKDLTGFSLNTSFTDTSGAYKVMVAGAAAGGAALVAGPALVAAAEGFAATHPGAVALATGVAAGEGGIVMGGGNLVPRSVGAAESALSIAERGGPNAGFLRQVQGWSRTQLERAVRSFQKQIELHEGYITDPASHVRGWGSMNSIQRDGLLNHWARELKNFSDQQSIASGLIK